VDEDKLLADAQNEIVALVEVVPLFKPLRSIGVVVVAEHAALVEPLLNCRPQPDAVKVCPEFVVVAALLRRKLVELLT
jgi:hypothetical protein